MGVIVRNKNITIAVLPFKVINKNERLRTLIHGLTEDLITNLSKFVGLAVISQLSTEQITDTSDYGEIDKLTADYLIIGSVRNVADSLRITIQLIKGDDKSVVFSEQYNKSVGEIFDAQDIIIQQIVNVLQKEINYDLLSYSYRKETVDVVVYENWLMGMETLKKGSVENDDIARQYFEAALKIDPHYAPAYTGLSLSYFNEWSCQVWDRWDVSRGNAHKYALKAIEFDKNDYRALAVLGRTYLYAGEYENAEHCARKSLRMNPNDTDNLLLVGFTLMYVGFPQEAAQLYQKAMELDPLHVENNYFAYGSGFYLECGDYEKSAELGLKVDTDRCWIDFPAFLAAAYFHLSDFDNM
jgi:TolB-like protein